MGPGGVRICVHGLRAAVLGAALHRLRASEAGGGMSERIPPGAFADCAKVEKASMTPNRAFDPRATSLVAMRKAVNEYEDRIAELEKEVAAMKARPFLTSRNGTFLRSPRGGVEDVAEMKAAGMQYLALNIGDGQHWNDWRIVVNRARALDVNVFPWARCRTADEVYALCDTADLVAFQVIVNVEDEFKDTLPPKAVATLLRDFDELEIAISMPAWAYNDVDYAPLAEYPMLLQLFPQDMRIDPSELEQKQRDCVTHARDKGFTYVGITCQTYGEDGVSYGKAKPEWYAYMNGGTRSLFTGDDVGASNWAAWA